MEKVQFRALKFIYDDTDSTYEELLAKSKLPTLKIRRIRTIAIETFFLNCLKELSSLKWFGSSFHVLAAKYLKVLIPYLVVLVDGILAVFWYLKEYLQA
jgi:apolipoprotein N-acyltransferase